MYSKRLSALPLVEARTCNEGGAWVLPGGRAGLAADRSSPVQCHFCFLFEVMSCHIILGQASWLETDGTTRLPNDLGDMLRSCSILMFRYSCWTGAASIDSMPISTTYLAVPCPSSSECTRKHVDVYIHIQSNIVTPVLGPNDPPQAHVY